MKKYILDEINSETDFYIIHDIMAQLSRQKFDIFIMNWYVVPGLQENQ